MSQDVNEDEDMPFSVFVQLCVIGIYELPMISFLTLPLFAVILFGMFGFFVGLPVFMAMLILILYLLGKKADDDFLEYCETSFGQS